MALLCFLLDLRSLPPPILKHLTDLANLYAISSSFSSDRIGLCYVLKNASSVPDDALLEVAYSPNGSFRLRDFHRAVENLPTDAFIPENDSETLCCRDVKLSAVLSDQVLFSWGGKDVMRKVIVISASAHYDLDSRMQRTLMEEAVNMHVSVEFMMFQQKSSHLNGIEKDANGLMKRVSDMDGCSLKSYLPDVRVFQSLVRRWLQDLKDDMQEPLIACFGFKGNLIYSMNQITCNLYMPVNQMADGFSPCQTCRCHGMPLEVYGRKGIKEPSCAITGHILDACNVMENSMKVGDKTILFLPPSQCLTKSRQSSSRIKFDIVQRTNLGTLCESIIMGASYVVVPSSLFELESASAGTDQFELNALVFQGLCGALHSLDQGLVCLSNWNMETLKESTFPCYYILQPSHDGSMFLRRLAGSEEVLYVPDIKTLITTPVSKEIQSSVLVSLEKVELKDYNPLMHERGLHQKLNVLVKESLEFGSLTPTAKEATSGGIESNGPDSMKNAVEEIETVMDGAEAGVAETWEQLVTHEFSDSCPVYVSKEKLDGFSLSLPDGNRELGVKTSRILERLEVPRQRTKATSPNYALSVDLVDTNGPTKKPNGPTKKPPIPLVPVLAQDQGLTGTQTQLMKPNFNKLKRKRT